MYNIDTVKISPHIEKEEYTMTNQEAYLEELESLRKDMEILLSLVSTKEASKKAEEVADRMRVTINCMARGYIPIEM